MNCGGNPCNFFCAASSMERETIYIQGDRATAAAESPRLITSGGSKAGIETPITITGGGSHSGHMVDSRGPMQELIPLGRSIAANSEDFAQAGELQARRRGGQSGRGQSSGSTIPVAAAGSQDSIAPSVGDASNQ